MVHQVYRGREEFRRAGIACTRQAEGHAGEEHGYHEIQRGGQKVEDEIQHGQGEDIAGEEGHGGGGSEIEESFSAHGQNRNQKGFGVETAADKAEQHTEQSGDNTGNGNHGKAGEEICHEQSFPADGQRVHEADGPGIVKITPHRHGAQDGI